MKRLLSALLSVVLAFGLLPYSAFAEINPQSEEFKSFLQEIGMSEEEFTSYLSETHDYSLEEFEDLTELKDYLGPLVNETNLQELLEEFEMTEEELIKLLEENETSLDQFIFYEDLYWEVSDYLYTAELTPITDENLQELLNEFDFKSKEELEAFLNKYDDSLENYDNMEDLYMTMAEHIFMESKDELINTLDSFGLSLAEANNLANHLLAILENPDLDQEQFLIKMEEIGQRLMNFPEFESAEDLSAEDIAEFIDVWNDLLNLFDLKVEYYLSKDGKETAISFESLLKMNSTNGADLIIKILSKDGKLLADMKITKDMFGSDFLQETGKTIEKTKETAEEVTKAAEKVPAVKVAKTVKGGKLPNTASDYLPNALAGFAMFLFGIFAIRKVRVKGV
ncbi:processed acidic surface protein [Mesobacillus sp. AQ2]|uniref:processed acidic surface protein n=1 Tax=Mesobacillus sp. AQ2 TaxID=3043332 RepID=UPI0024C11A74|nr:processed acidic surface protein [Mesobacillus sp. AQ2]WHX40251.1 processed acidic surface protein [Mesobacillus sp. AQ2]